MLQQPGSLIHESGVSSLPKFSELNLIDPLLKALDGVGYETPSPIQALTIPLIMEGRDVSSNAGE
jgi:ATP-dependent RNA helicase DeaD